MIDTSSLVSFASFEEADLADKKERWAMTPGERLLLLERLRQCCYPDGKTAPRLQRILEPAAIPRR